MKRVIVFTTAFAVGALAAAQTLPPSGPTMTEGQIEKLVTVRFKDAPVADVLEWLTEQKVSFVYSYAGEGHKTVNINVVNQPLGKILHALAMAWEGHWQDAGGILIFVRGWSAMPQSSIHPGTPMPPPMSPGFPAEPPGMVPAQRWDDVPIAFTAPAAAQPMDLVIARGVSAAGSGSVAAVIRSVSPQQWQKHAKQGYLKFSDLSKWQRGRLGIALAPGEAISLIAGGKKLVLKGG